MNESNKDKNKNKNSDPSMRPPRFIVMLIPLAIALVISLFYFVLVPALTSPRVEEIAYSEFKTMIASGKIKRSPSTPTP